MNSRAASAPGPVRGVDDEPLVPIAVEDEGRDVLMVRACEVRLDDEAADELNDDTGASVDICRRATARARDPMKGDVAFPPGATTKAERRMGDDASSRRSTLGERRARRVVE
ncbi:MAG: hypothetical protein ACO28Q_07875 [Ilumatobacteraceae bacterium]